MFDYEEGVKVLIVLVLVIAMAILSLWLTFYAHCGWFRFSGKRPGALHRLLLTTRRAIGK